ncbi:MAG: hypothetical protein RLN89_08520 [Parvibaculum sp.]
MKLPIIPDLPELPEHGAKQRRNLLACSTAICAAYFLKIDICSVDVWGTKISNLNSTTIVLLLALIGLYNLATYGLTVNSLFAHASSDAYKAKLMTKERGKNISGIDARLKVHYRDNADADTELKMKDLERVFDEVVAARVAASELKAGITDRVRFVLVDLIFPLILVITAACIAGRAWSGKIMLHDCSASVTALGVV